jgi:hypothetical protein
MPVSLPLVGQFVLAVARSRSTLAAENLFLRKQLALFQERKVKPRRADDATRWMMVALGRHVHRLAPQRIPALLALEIEIDRRAAAAKTTEGIDPRDGRRKSNLG